MTMERRMEAIEEISRLLINASRGMNESIQRLETLQRQREGTIQELSETVQELSASVRRLETSVQRLETSDREREETLQALSESIRVTNEALQSLMAFVPETQAEIIRLDSRIDQIEAG